MDEAEAKQPGRDDSEPADRPPGAEGEDPARGDKGDDPTDGFPTDKKLFKEWGRDEG